MVLTLTIATMNAINRMGISFRMKPRAMTRAGGRAILGSAPVQPLFSLLSVASQAIREARHALALSR